MIKKIPGNHIRNRVDTEDAFLCFVKQDMDKHPESIQPITNKVIDEIANLVAGVDID